MAGSTATCCSPLWKRELVSPVSYNMTSTQKRCKNLCVLAVESMAPESSLHRICRKSTVRRRLGVDFCFLQHLLFFFCLFASRVLQTLVNRFWLNLVLSLALGMSDFCLHFAHETLQNKHPICHILPTVIHTCPLILCTIHQSLWNGALVLKMSQKTRHFRPCFT